MKLLFLWIYCSKNGFIQKKDSIFLVNFFGSMMKKKGYYLLKRKMVI